MTPLGPWLQSCNGEIKPGTDNAMDVEMTERRVSNRFFLNNPIESPDEDITRDEEQGYLFSEAKMVKTIKAMKNGKAPDPEDNSECTQVG